MLKKYIIGAGLLATAWSMHSAQAQQLTNQVNLLIGTGGHGHTYPGATVPFSMVQLSPDNGKGGWDWVSGYHISSDSIAGFSHMHLSGTGIGDWLDIAVMPMTAPVHQQLVDTRVKFSRTNEQATPGYYRVKLDNNITAELTSTERVGFHQYTFPAGTKKPTIRLDLDHTYNWDKPLETEIVVVNDSTLVGKRYSQGWANRQQVYFALRTSAPVKEYLLNGAVVTDAQKQTSIINDGKKGKAKAVNAQLVFAENSAVQVKVALSMTSEAKALAALNEIPNWNFTAVRNQAQQKWESELGKIKVESKDQNLKTIFYSALYHTAVAPTLYSDSDGEYKNYKGELHKMPNGEQRYTFFSLWDTFRALKPLFTITQPERYTAILNSLLAFHDENGLLPVWDLSTFETNTMTGYHAIPVLADAILKDWPGIDQERAYQAMRNSAFQDIREVPAYIEYGYVPQDVNGGSVTKTLEYAFDDYCIARVAQKLGKQDDVVLFTKRAKNYIHHFDPQTGFMRAKYKNGKFVEPFDPFYSEHDFDKSQYIEGNAWQHSFFVPHDVRGLAKLFPAKNGLSAMLDTLFTAPSHMTGENQSPDASGFIGQYAHGNEPSHHIAYMYAYIGEAWKTQEKIRHIVDSMYHNLPDGYAGNEDAGQMSAWAVWSMMGLYPASPVGGEYVFGSPSLDRASISMPSGKTFTIVANNNAKENVYIKSAKLNGKSYTKMYITHEDMLKGGELVFEMSDKPNKKFGKKKGSWPTSMEN
ncbi:GH92 family glycosyl hydrolase [Sphingobacterium oryzagri]|uniref:GH92 family glycosyl hydrolase n=1 Tax=Sphingobacterium oryzagri TaxID=3025669 RepID=A0ABY7WIR4_9SPHI|nr:GH92 family glycosyl hydrolase [Sphingobacterium sp. KACC 22765]WDF68185.1 GH92 family glycosyl hydrolase [Sphingobacterium sp. KACC 22765]